MTTQTKTTREEQPQPTVVSSGGSRGGLLALLSVALVGGVMYSAYQFGKRPGDGLTGGVVATASGAGSGAASGSGAAEAPTLVADSPLRSAPENPGGRVAPDQNRAAYESLGSRPIDIEPTSARVTVLETAQETERPLGPMTSRAVDSAADAAALRARNTEIHSIGLAAVPPRTDMARPAETFSLDAPDRDLAAPGIAAALAGGARGPQQAVAAGPRVAAVQGGAPGAQPQAGPTLAAAQALAQGQPQTTTLGAAPAGFAPSAALPAGAPAGPETPAVVSEAPQSAPAPRPRPTPAAAPSVVSAVRAMTGVESAAPGTAAMVARTQTAAAAPQPAPNVGFAPQPARTFAPGEAMATLGQEFASASVGVDPRLAAAQAAQAAQAAALAEAQRQAQLEALRLAQSPAQPWGAPLPAQQQFAAAPQPTYAAPAPQARSAGAQIQIGALPSPDQVHQRWFALQQRNPDLLGGLQLDIQPVTTGAGQQLFRLRAGPLADQRAARSLCAALQARGVDCFVPNS